MNKIITLFAGFALIGAICYWFFGKKKSLAKAAEQSSDSQRTTITVDGGYSPNNISLILGKPAVLTFIRKDASSCLEEVILPDFGVSEKLPVNKPFEIRIMPDKVGEFTYTCGMRMFSGHIEVQK